jgi:hypothetical protein
VNPHRICWQLGLGGQATIIFFILAADADAWAYHYFFGMKLVFEISNGIDEGIIYLCTNVYISHIVS